MLAICPAYLQFSILSTNLELKDNDIWHNLQVKYEFIVTTNN